MIDHKIFFLVNCFSLNKIFFNDFFFIDDCDKKVDSTGEISELKTRKLFDLLRFFGALVASVCQLSISVVTPAENLLLAMSIRNCNSEESSNEYFVDRRWQDNFFGLKKFSETTWAPNVKITIHIDCSAMVARSYRCNVLELGYQSGSFLINFVANSQLSVLIVASSKHMTFGCEYKSVKDSALHLLSRLW